MAMNKPRRPQYPKQQKSESDNRYLERKLDFYERTLVYYTDVWEDLTCVRMAQDGFAHLITLWNANPENRGKNRWSHEGWYQTLREWKGKRYSPDRLQDILEKRGIG